MSPTRRDVIASPSAPAGATAIPALVTAESEPIEIEPFKLALIVFGSDEIGAVVSVAENGDVLLATDGVAAHEVDPQVLVSGSDRVTVVELIDRLYSARDCARRRVPYRPLSAQEIERL